MKFMFRVVLEADRPDIQSADLVGRVSKTATQHNDMEYFGERSLIATEQQRITNMHHLLTESSEKVINLVENNHKITDPVKLDKFNVGLIEVTTDLQKAADLNTERAIIAHNLETKLESNRNTKLSPEMNDKVILAESLQKKLNKGEITLSECEIQLGLEHSLIPILFIGSRFVNKYSFQKQGSVLCHAASLITKCLFLIFPLFSLLQWFII